MLAEHIGVAVIAEPYMVPDSLTWIGDTNKRVAICWNPSLVPYSCVTQHRGDGYVMATIGHIMVISVYLRPSENIERTLEKITDHISRTHYEDYIIAGDFNARSIRWGDRTTNSRGEAVETWADQLDLRLVNEGNTPTCVKAQGDSIIDLT